MIFSDLSSLICFFSTVTVRIFETFDNTNKGSETSFHLDSREFDVPSSKQLELALYHFSFELIVSRFKILN